MSVAKCLGLDQVDGPALTAAAVAWQRWCHEDPDLAVVDELLDLPDWTCRVPVASKDSLLVRLHSLAQQDAEAASVLAWLLIPGATRLADGLRDLSTDIDALTAGELWMRIRARPVNRCVAATILRAVRRCLLAELGHGAAAQRHDRAWANTVLCERTADLDPHAATPPADAIFESSHLIQHALLHGVLSNADASLLARLADEADAQAASARRGRGGLTSPAVVESVTGRRPESARSVRRQAVMLMELLARFASEERLVEDLAGFVAAHALPPMSLEEVIEMHLWEHIDEYLDELHRELGETA